MSGIRSVKIAQGLKHEYVTQNGRVVRDYVTYAGTDTFVRCTDFFYDEAGRPFAMRCYYDSTLTGADTFHYVLNAQGDVVKLNYQGGTVYAEYSYDAWGNVTSIKGNSNSGSLYYAERNPLRYRGYYYDTETGFYYLQSRYYDPIVKRFLNADSYGSTGQGFLGFNMFAYCRNRPISRKDSDGRDDEKAIEDGKIKLDELIEKYATIDENGFQVDIESETDEWDSAIKAVGIQESYDYIADQLCNKYYAKYGEEFLFSNECISYEIEYHIDAYMCATDHDGYHRNITTYFYSYDTLKEHCRKIDIYTSDVYEWKQRKMFSYKDGIRQKYQNTSKDPFYHTICFSFFGWKYTYRYRSSTPK